MLELSSTFGALISHKILGDRCRVPKPPTSDGQTSAQYLSLSTEGTHQHKIISGK